MKEQLAPTGSLWQRAPALRYTCWLGSGLTVLAVVLPLLHGVPEQTQGGTERAKPANPIDHPAFASQSVTTQSAVSANPGAIKTQQSPASVRSETGSNSTFHEPYAVQHERTARAPGSHVAPQTQPAGTPIVPNVSGTTEQTPLAETARPATQPPALKKPRFPLPVIRLPEMTYPEKSVTPSRLPGQEVISHCENLPREPSRSITPGATEARSPADGITCFFNATGSLYDVRMDMPFSQAVDGVRIGDDIEGVTQRLGAPQVQRQFGSRTSYIYYRTSTSFERFDVQAGTVQTIFIGPR